MLSLSDFIAQRLTIKYKSNQDNNELIVYDHQRTLALFTFGVFYYGMIAKGIYLGYDAILGNGLGLAKAMIDVTINGSFVMLPSFYMITGTVKVE